jgi:hypothetical protein
MSRRLEHHTVHWPGFLLVDPGNVERYMNRNERIAAAQFFVWRGQKLEASAGLFAALLDAHRRLVQAGGEAPVALDNVPTPLVLTEVEDLLDLCRDAQLALAKARGAG